MVRSDREPSNAGSRMIQHGSREPRFFDHPVLVQQRTDPPEIDIARAKKALGKEPDKKEP